VDNDQLQDDLERMSGSPALAKQLTESLRRITDGGAGPELAEMAGEILAGRTDLRTIANTSVYATQLTEAVGRFRHWYDELTPEERDQLTKDTRAYLDTQHY
jgi:hypothetical protein